MNPKRLVITAGDARVGKSTTIRLLLDLYLESGLKVRAYYNGYRNKLFAYEMLLPVGELQLTRGGADELLIELERFRETAVALADMPGQHLPQFKEFAKETLLFESLASLGYRITFVHPISYRRDCVESLQELLNFCGTNADYVVVKNLSFDDDFPYYDGADIQQRILDSGGVELCLGNLPKYTYELVEFMNLPYSEAVCCSEIYAMYRSQIFNWIDEFIQQILNEKPASKLLGITHILLDDEQNKYFKSLDFDVIT